MDMELKIAMPHIPMHACFLFLSIQHTHYTHTHTHTHTHTNRNRKRSTEGKRVDQGARRKI